MPPEKTLKEVLEEARKKLSAYSIENGNWEAKKLLQHVCRLTESDLILKENKILPETEHRSFQHLLQLRIQGLPLGRLLGERSFWTLDLKIGPHTLEPRQDTERLVETILNEIDQSSHRDKALKILDLGTGSGAILLSLLSELPNASGIGADISLETIQYAQWNAQRYKLSDRCYFICANWLDSIKGHFDIVVSNPPYIDGYDYSKLDETVRQYDPMIALKPGKTGLEAYEQIIKSLKNYSELITTNIVCFEIGHMQKSDVEDALTCLTDFETSCIKDLVGKDRVILSKVSR